MRFIRHAVASLRQMRDAPHRFLSRNIGQAPRRHSRRQSTSRSTDILKLGGGLSVGMLLLGHAEASKKGHAQSWSLLDAIHAAEKSRTRCDGPAQSGERGRQNRHSKEEEEEFRKALEYYRHELPWYRKEWAETVQPRSSEWLGACPTADEISSIEYDLRFCKLHRPEQPDQARSSHCKRQQFRAALFYLESSDLEQQRKGYKIIKDLAEHGYADAMCMHGILLNEGRPNIIDSNPKAAVVWWKNCIDQHGHTQSTYEYAIALYMGEGVVEDPALGVQYFERIANHHVSAAYMLGECLLDGIGTARSRAAALSWLIVAAELGHRGAQRRVLTLLESACEKYPDDETGTLFETDTAPAQVMGHEDGSGDEDKEKTEHENDACGASRFNAGCEDALERRYTIGGGSRNVHIHRRRSSIVQDSRGDET